MLKVTINEVPKLIELCNKSRNNLLILGDPGTGKSTVVNGMKDKGYKVTMLTGSSTYEETVNGIPYNDTERKSSTGVNMSTYNVPSWLEDIYNHKGKQILFIDEFNTAEPEVLKTFLSVLTEHKVPTQPDLPLPDDCVIVMAMNPSDQNDGTDLIRPVKSRVMVVRVESTIPDFSAYIKKENKRKNVSNELIDGLLSQVGLDQWGTENEYTEMNPRSFSNFLDALDSAIEMGDNPETSVQRLSMAFFSFQLRYDVTSKTKKTRNAIPTYQELEKMTTNGLIALADELKKQVANVKAVRAVADINKILIAREMK